MKFYRFRIEVGPFVGLKARYKKMDSCAFFFLVGQN